MPGSPSSVCVANSSFFSGFSFRGTGEAGRGISALSPPASLPPVLLYASPGASPLGDPTSLWEVTGGGDTCAACSRSGGRLVLVSCRFVPPRRSSALLPDGSWRLCREPTCPTPPVFSFPTCGHLELGAPSPGCWGDGRVFLFALLFCVDPGGFRGRHGPRPLAWCPDVASGGFRGHSFPFSFFFFARFLIVSNSHPFALFEKPAECIVYNDSLA